MVWSGFFCVFLGFARGWEVLLAPFLYRLASPYMLTVCYGGLSSFSFFVLIYSFAYLSKKKKHSFCLAYQKINGSV